MSEVFFSLDDNQIQFSHASYDKMPPTSFHLHNGCEIYLLVAGDVSYFIENKIYSISFGDLVITNSDELHMVSFLSDKHYERYYLVFSPAFAAYLSTAQTNLLKCFLERNKGENNTVTLTPLLLDKILGLLKRMEYLGSVKPYGFDVLFNVCFIELLVLINEASSGRDKNIQHQKLPSKLLPILNYIDNNLNTDLSLEALAQKFYINKHYLRKLFKNANDFSLHKYILYRRIANAKILLRDGLSVMETAEACGFNDYCSFIRTFKKIVGIPPGKFAKYGHKPHII